MLQHRAMNTKTLIGLSEAEDPEAKVSINGPDNFGELRGAIRRLWRQYAWYELIYRSMMVVGCGWTWLVYTLLTFGFTNEQN